LFFLNCRKIRKNGTQLQPIGLCICGIIWIQIQRRVSKRARGWMPVVSNDLLRNLFYVAIFTLGLSIAEIGGGLVHITDWFDDDGGFDPETDAQM